MKALGKASAVTKTLDPFGMVFDGLIHSGILYYDYDWA